MGILREVRRLPDAIHRLTAAVNGLSNEVAASKADVGTERLDELERSRSLWEADMEALMIRADSKYKAAANAESRTRKQLEKLDPFGEEGEPVPTGIPPEYAEVGEAEGLQPLPLGMAEPSQRELAKRMKFLS